MKPRSTSKRKMMEKMIKAMGRRKTQEMEERSDHILLSF